MDLLQKLCCFFILAKIVLQMCPSEKYEKYLQVLVTWMLYAMILLPLLGKGRTDSLQNWQQFRKEYEKSFTERLCITEGRGNTENRAGEAICSAGEAKHSTGEAKHRAEETKHRAGAGTGRGNGR